MSDDSVKQLRDSCYVAFDDGTNDYDLAHKTAARIEELKAERDAAVAAAYEDAAKWAEKERQVCNAQGDRAGAVAYRRLCVFLSALTPADGVAALERVRREARNEALEEAAKHHDRHADGYRNCSRADAAAHEEHARRIRSMMEDDDT